MPSCHSLLSWSRTAPLASEPEAVLGDRRPQQVAAELLEPGAVVRRHEQVGVEIEAIEVGLARTGRGNPGRVGVVPDPQDVGPGPPAEGDPSLDGGAADASQGERLLGERIRRRRVGVLRLQASTCEEPSHASADRGEEPGNLLVAGSEHSD